MFRSPVVDGIVILIIALLILGPKRLPGLGKGLGVGMREFGVRDLERHARHAIIAVSREDDDRMMRLAAFGQDARIGDLHHLLAPARQRVGRTFQQPPERGPLHFVLLQGAVGKKPFAHFVVENLNSVTW